MIVLKSEAEIDAMREAGRLASQTLDLIGEHVRPGVSTLEINDICHQFIVDNQAIPAPLNYRGFPKSVCTSVNEVVCHGIPNSKQRLKEGDIINIDVTTIVDGFHGDTSRMFMVGERIAPNAKKLVQCAKECLEAGIEMVAVGARLGDIGAAIEARAKKDRYSVVREFVGHGIGREFHEDPQVLHYGKQGTGARLREGMVFTIEPMINEGKWQTKILKDGWTAVTIDGRLSAQWEHTIAIRRDGRVEILTVS